MIRPGLIAWADSAPGFRPPDQHPALIVRSWSNGNLGLAFISHSYEGAVSYPFTRSTYPGAFRDLGGPLTDEEGRVILKDHHGDRVLIAQPHGTNQLKVGTAIITLTYQIQIPPKIWKPLADDIKRHWEA